MCRPVAARRVDPAGHFPHLRATAPVGDQRPCSLDGNVDKASSRRSTCRRVKSPSTTRRTVMLKTKTRREVTDMGRLIHEYERYAAEDPSRNFQNFYRHVKVWDAIPRRKPPAWRRKTQRRRFDK